MVRVFITGLFILVLASCGSSGRSEKSMALKGPEPRETISFDSLNIPVYDFDGVEPLFRRNDGTTYVINFWATWCAPCVKELPYFERLQSEYQSEELQVILVNLDMPGMWESHLVPFVRENQLASRIVILDDPKQNDWIPKIDDEWSGAIPATLIYNGDKRMFFEGPFTYEKLSNVLSNFKI